MSILAPKAFTRFGAIDSDAFVDGAPCSAHVLRTMGMSSNRLATRGHPLLNFAWDADLDLDIDEYLESGVHLCRVVPWWRPITAVIPVRKMPIARSATLYYKIGVSDGDKGIVSIQVATMASPLNPVAVDGRTVVTLDGVDTALDLFAIQGSLTDIPLREGVEERVQFFLRGSFGGLADEGTYGAGSSAEVERLLNANSFRSSSATWNDYSDPDNLAARAHLVRFMSTVNGVFSDLVTPREIIRVESGDELVFRPGLTDEEMQAVTYGGGCSYRIVEAPLARPVFLSLYANEVTL